MSKRDVSVRTRPLALLASSTHGHGKLHEVKVPRSGLIKTMRTLAGKLKVDTLVQTFHEFVAAKTSHWALQTTDIPPGDPWTGIVAELVRYKSKSDVNFTEGEEPKDFRAVDEIYTEILRRLHGETYYTNEDIRRQGHRVIERQPEYGLLDSNCQRFVTILAWEILKTPSFELDLIAGRATFDEAEVHVNKGEVKKDIEPVVVETSSLDQ